jgi:hypothetical protein
MNENRPSIWRIVGALVIVAIVILVFAALGGINLSRIPGLNSSSNGGNTSIFDTDGTTTSDNSNNSSSSSSALYASCLGQGTYIEVAWDTYRVADHYVIPRSQLTAMANGRFLMFEGEQSRQGLHEIMPVVATNGEFAPQVTNEGLSLYQGSFWTYTDGDQGCVATDDLLMVFAHDKRANWTTQGMRGNPIKVWLSSGAVSFQPDEEVTLSDAQDTIAVDNSDQRCPTGNEVREENPLGDHDSSELVVSQIGSSSCQTLLVRGTTARYFMGARDGVSYHPNETRIFLVPASWGETEMRAFLNGQGISFNSIGQMP